jgi:hypothetical protein
LIEEDLLNENSAESPELTPADLKAFRLLEELGIDRRTVIAVDMVCNRNKSQAEDLLASIVNETVFAG